MSIANFEVQITLIPKGNDKSGRNCPSTFINGATLVGFDGPGVQRKVLAEMLLATVEDLLNKYSGESKVYGIGYKVNDEEWNMLYGPNPHVSSMMDIIPTEGHYILELKADKHIELYRGNGAAWVPVR
jgi:hypothetical protein